MSTLKARRSMPSAGTPIGMTWPGVEMTSRLASGAAATRMVRARSWAETPVVTFARASIDV